MAGWGLADKIFSQEKDRFEARGTALVKLKPGKHTIAVAALISDPALMRMTGYVDLRAALEASQSDQEASRRLKEYLLPDDDAAERLVRIGRYRYIARIYEVEVDNSWVAVTALFLPRRPLTELMGYLPQQKTYGFNASDVRRELAFYKVPERDRADLLDALGRVGRMSYRNSDDEPYRLFQIDPNDGRIASERLDY
jgi:hypothetical protein